MNKTKEPTFRPNKLLGQNFLFDKTVLNRIIQTANLSKDDVVLEVGPGTGTLTREIAKKAQKVIAVEKDKQLADNLKKEFENQENVEIVEGDVLKMPMLSYKRCKIVANIPYYLTSPLIRSFLEAENPPQEMVLMVQEEVAKRICAKPPKMNFMAAVVQLYAQVKIAFYVSRNSFWPSPKVDSAVIKITNINRPKTDEKQLLMVLRAGFSSPRKKLINNLSRQLKLKRNELENVFKKHGLGTDIRAQRLSVEDWIELSQSIGQYSVDNC